LNSLETVVELNFLIYTSCFSKKEVTMDRKSYLDDLKDEEWAQIEPILQEGIYRRAGSRGKYSRREMLNAIFYILRTGCRWRDLPHDFPPWTAVYSQFVRWQKRGIFAKMNDCLRKSLRVLLGKTPETTAGIIDSQSVKTTEKKGFADSMEIRKLKVEKDTYWWITLDC
jgi:transposase